MNSNNETNWSVYEANVQAYRSNFISSQSFMLAVAAIVLDKSFVLTFIISTLSIIQIWYIWFRIIHIRTIVVDFYKYQMYKYFDNNGGLKDNNTINYLCENTYVRNKFIRKKVNENMSKFFNRGEKTFHNFRLTRIKIDIIIPILFTIIWIAFLCYSFIYR